MQGILHIEIYDVRHVFEGLSGTGLAAIIHLRFLDRSVGGKARKLHVLAAHFEDSINIGVVMLDAESVTGYLISYSVRAFNAFFLQSPGFFLAYQNFLVQFSCRTGSSDPLDNYLVFVPSKIFYNLFQRFLWIAVCFDIKLVQQLSGPKFDQCPLGCSTAAVYSQNNFRSLLYCFSEFPALLVYFVE